jgi:ADP-ribosylglycohydrolase
VLGAIAGDVIGSVHEFAITKTTSFDLFVPASTYTDDTVLAVAVADCVMNGRRYVDSFLEYFHAYPNRGYGLRFAQWARSGTRQPYNSYGNGSAMRVPAIGYAYGSLEAVLAEAARSAEVTHNHPEGIKGAMATAGSVFLARQGDGKRHIKAWVERTFGYSFEHSLADLRPSYRFDESCQLTVPAALLAFLESDDYEDAIRKAISLGGDADTLACIAGGIAEAHYGGVPAEIAAPTLALLDERLRGIVIAAHDRYNIPLETRTV